MNVKEWVLKNISAAYVAVKIKDKETGEIIRSQGLAPQSVTPVRNIFRKPDGSADLMAARANEDVVAHCAAKVLELAEREVWQKEASGPGPLFNENDPEPERVRKILEHRQSTKANARRSHEPASPPKKTSAKPEKEE